MFYVLCHQSIPSSKASAVINICREVRVFVLGVTRILRPVKTGTSSRSLTRDNLLESQGQATGLKYHLGLDSNVDRSKKIDMH